VGGEYFWIKELPGAGFGIENRFLKAYLQNIYYKNEEQAIFLNRYPLNNSDTIVRTGRQNQRGAMLLWV